MSKSSGKKQVSLLELAASIPDVLKDWNKVAEALWYNYTTYPDTAVSIGDLFLKTVRKYPENVALLHKDRIYRYAELNSWVNRLSHHFLHSGIRRGTVVAVMLENRPEIIAVMLALSKIGAIAALLNTSQKGKTLLHSIQLSKAALVLIGAEYQEVFAEIAEDVKKERPSKGIYLIPHAEFKNNSTFPDWEIESFNFPDKEPWVPFRIKAKDAAMYIYTSGTSGLPKASRITHGRWVKAYSAFGLISLRLTPDDILYVSLPFYHATAMVVCWSSVVAGGAAMVMKNKFSVSEFWPDIHQYKATAFGYVGELCKYLLTAPDHPLEKNSTLKKMIGNGLRPGIWQEFKDRFGIEKVAEFYASSEGNIAFFNVFNIDNSMGFTVTSYAIVEYDKDAGQPLYDKNGYMIKVQPGGVGLLLGEINERYPFDGYTEKNKTESVIFRNVFSKGDAWFNTGDLVRDMGWMHTQFVDRLGDTFRWKSENVSTTEVEDIICQFDGITEAVVYGVEVPGQAGRAGMAKIMTETDHKIDLELFYQYLQSVLPSYAVPVFLHLAASTEMTSTFKYKKSELKEIGYNCEKLDGEVYVLLKKQYRLMDIQLRDEINQGKHRL